MPRFTIYCAAFAFVLMGGGALVPGLLALFLALAWPVAYYVWYLLFASHDYD